MTRQSLLLAAILVAGVLFAGPAYAGEEMVPDVVGLRVEEAKALMDEAGFTARVQNVPGKRIGIVLSQDPGGMATRDTATPVTLRVVGPTPKPGPGPTPPADDGPPAGLPRTDGPPAGAGTSPMDQPPTSVGKADRDPVGGAHGYVWNGVPVPAEPMVDTNGPNLPGVLGQTARQAQRALNRYRVRVEQTSAMPELVGQVLNQWPFAGSRLALGEEVTIVVGVARAPSRSHRGVPQVQDRPWREAGRTVETAGFKVEFSAVQSPDAKQGQILSQSPLPGSLLARGQTMRLRIGCGTGAYVPGEAGREPDPAPRDPVPRDPAPKDPAPKDPAAADGPPAGPGTSPIEMPPTATPPADTPPAGAPPVDTPPADAPPKDPGGKSPGKTPTLSAPALRTPPAGESYPHKYGADFTWTAIAGATGYELELQEELPSGAWKTLHTHKLGTTRFRPAKLERGRYRWRVRAVGDGSEGGWSEYRRLYMY